MLSPVKIKICGLTSETDVDLSVESGADYFGFIVFAGSPRAVSLERAAQLAARVPEEKRVIVDVGTSPEALLRYRAAGFGNFQLHGTGPFCITTLAKWSEIVGPDRLWYAPRIAPTDAFPKEALMYAETILLDTYSESQVGGTGKTGEWGRFAEWRQRYCRTNFILAGGLTPANVRDAIRSTGAVRVDVNSGVESEPGRKNPEKLREFFRVLKAA